MQAFENQDYPFEELVDQVEVNRDASRNPLFDVVFALQNMFIQSGSIPEVNVPQLGMVPITQYKQEPGTQDNQEYSGRSAKFDLTLYAIESEDQLSFLFEYCTRLFKRETIQRFVVFFKDIAAAVTADKNIKLADINISHALLTAKEDAVSDDAGDFKF